MALTAYTRFRYLWGAVDYTQDDEAPTYGSANTQADVPATHSARRVQIYWSRPVRAEDRMMTHMDLLNITSGQVDDTWTAGDFTAVETALDAWWSPISAHFTVDMTLDEFRWYRLGPSATPPEPAVRVTDRNVPGSSATSPMPYQTATSVTFKTGSRKHWGRNYLPYTVIGNYVASQSIYSTTYITALANAYHTLVQALAAADFQLVVYSRPKPARETKAGKLLPEQAARFYTVEQIQVDNQIDIIRRRRATQNTVRVVKP
jgi:hypothetical protein